MIGEAAAIDTAELHGRRQSTSDNTEPKTWHQQRSGAQQVVGEGKPAWRRGSVAAPEKRQVDYVAHGLFSMDEFEGVT
jgi:hypothetical protein